MRLRRRVGRVVLAEVDHVLAVARPVRLSGSAHERSPTDLTAHEAAPRRLGVGPAHRADGDAESLGQVAVGRQAAPLAQRPGREVLRESLGDDPIAWPCPSSEPRRPDCHGDNIAIDTSN